MKYFTIAEMVRSDTADRQGITNRLPKELVFNVQASRYTSTAATAAPN